VPDLTTDSIFQQYQAERTPERLNAVVDSLSPTINYTLASLRSNGDPLMHTKARVLAAKAIQRFDGSAGASLPTWVSQQLMPLRRFKRQSQAVVRVPERMQLDAMSLMQAENNFRDKYDREPNVGELADFAKMPVRRISAIRSTIRPTPSATAMGENMSATTPDYSQEALDYIYHSADHTDRKILEHKIGYGGAERLTPQETARKLGLSPTQLSRRSARLAIQIQEIEGGLETV
jgi:DNA-directed RNA polymerase specialized sigma subunit